MAVKKQRNEVNIPEKESEPRCAKEHDNTKIATTRVSSHFTARKCRKDDAIAVQLAHNRMLMVRFY